MKTACLQFNPIQENTYVVWDDTKQCVGIAAGTPPPRGDAALDNFIAGHGLEPVMAINTHGHFDHTLGVGHLKERYGIPFALSGKDRFLLDNASASGSVFGVKVGAMPPAEIDLDGTPVSAAGLHDFCNGYLDVFNRGFHYAFIAAIVMMLVSLVIYLSNKQRFPDPSKKAAAGGAKASAEEITMSAQEIRQRIYALFAVFGVVIFFWVSFHQNGYSLTYFARDYVNLDVININLGFTTIKGAEIFQSVNPFFVVTLTPLIMWFFGWLRKRNIEVSTPMKIAIGMGIAATAYLFLMFFSFALPDKAALAGMKADQVQSILVTPWVMVGLYFILTVAELFISPLGLAFVSKVAPPHMQGLMQGFWLAATAVGNALLFVGGWLYMHTPMWATWCVFVAACGMSMLVMLSMVRWLERVTK